MSDSILKFANKLEIRYSFNNKSNYMDAMTKHRCEKEILTLIRSLADMLDVKLTVYNEPYDKEGGFREKLGVAGELYLYRVELGDADIDPSLLVGGWTTADGPYAGGRGGDAA